ncbi:MAG: PilZ domain-containing protein [Deltaproteobacteria bacterium]|nr:PilZ domain-containing protein [Deltaproteobacteria bacterium]
MEGQEEQRRYPRAVVSLSVEFCHQDNKEKARALNLSESGMLIETKSPAPLAERVTVAFKISEEQEPVEVDGEVVWVNKYSANYPFGMAVKFQGLQNDTQEMIRDYVNKILESPSASRRDDLKAIPD